MFDQITDKIKTDKSCAYLLSNKDVDYIVSLIERVVNLSEEIGFYEKKLYKDNLKKRREQVYVAIMERIYSPLVQTKLPINIEEDI